MIEWAEFCTKHNKQQASLFCKNDGCQKAICQLCVINEHRAHDLVDMKEDKAEKTATLFSKIETTINELQDKKDKYLDAIGEADERSD